MTLADICVTPLRRIATPGGDVMHAMKRVDPGFTDFGEAYFSWIESGAVKAWKLHQRMTLNLVVPVGAVRFVFHLPQGGFRTEEIGAANYARLTVPPGIWFGFQGRADTPSLLLNLADIPHDPDEVLRKAQPDIPFDWQSP
ncbi:MAG: dTDP-4-dehydrorhamnose 3,5-epimerase [Sterolibacteriaceae bacterium MAG5]|nr:dTDP-4-dehydrorhamnose 3,5-epimerase [Candidatus Nitricoxidireducens bremensis]